MGEKDFRHGDDHEQDLDHAAAQAGEHEAGAEHGKDAAGAGYLGQAKVKSGTTDVTEFKDEKTQSYAHGAFMGAAGAFMHDPLWNQIFAAVWKEEWERVSKIEDTRTCMLALENNPVLSAYGECQATQHGGQKKGEADPQKAGVVPSEWDVWIDKEDPGNLSKTKIAHGSLTTTILQSAPGMKDTTVGYNRKDVQNAKNSAQWMEIFGQAIAMYRAGAAPEAGAGDKQPDGRAEAMQAALKATTAEEAMATCANFMRKENGGGLILDVKSTYSTPADINTFIDSLKARGIYVMGVGTFRHTQLDGIEEGVRQVKFFHAITGVANAGASGGLKQDDHLMFNAGSLVKQQGQGYVVDEGALQTLSDLVNKFNLYVGLYVQEGDIDEKAVDTIMKLVNRMPHLFKDGFAYGNVSGKAETETDGSGMGSQAKADALDKAAAAPRTIGEKVKGAWDSLWN
ncbi:MAG TPA: hypothetical protein VHE35_19910 [Kofleriaceae bacterium]|nr:hypothetical protein [Kofleriaceae bacterium]